MLRKKKIRHRLPVAEVNVVTLMDVLTTLLFFLLLASSFNQFKVLQATSLPANSVNQPDPKPVFSLQVAIEGKNSAAIYLGPIEKLNVQNRKSLVGYLKKRYKGNEKVGFVRKIKKTPLKKILRIVQANLKEIKKSFPGEKKAVVVVSDKIRYQELINVVAAVRSLPADRKAFELENLLGQIEKTKVLFPEVIIAEIDPDTAISKGSGAS